MSLGSGFLENIPHFTFTPTEHQVECVKVAGARNLTFVLTKPQEKSFLVLMLVREVAQCVRNGAGKAALLLYNANQVNIFTLKILNKSFKGFSVDEFPHPDD